MEVSRSVVAIKRDLLSGSLQREISREREVKGSFYESTGGYQASNFSKRSERNVLGVSSSVAVEESHKVDNKIIFRYGNMEHLGYPIKSLKKSPKVGRLEGNGDV